MNEQPLYSSNGYSGGYLVEGALWNVNGVKIGVFHKNEVYGHNGLYMGELRNGRLSMNLRKIEKRKGGFVKIRRKRFSRAPRIAPIVVPKHYRHFFHHA